MLGVLSIYLHHTPYFSSFIFRLLEFLQIKKTSYTMNRTQLYMLQLCQVKHPLISVSIDWQSKRQLSYTRTRTSTVGRDNALHLPKQSKQCGWAPSFCGKLLTEAPSKKTARPLILHFSVHRHRQTELCSYWLRLHHILHCASNFYPSTLT